MNMINKTVISELKPCKDRFDNYIKHYGRKEHTRAQFMGLRNITQSDKMWVSFRLMSRDNILLAATDIAESVLHIYENKYPGDSRPRRAIEAARIGNANADAYAAAANAAYAADAAATNAANAAYAAYAAYAAAANAAAAAAAAADAYAAAANAAYAAYAAAAAAADATNATNAAADRDKQEKLIRRIVLKYWKRG